MAIYFAQSKSKLSLGAQKVRQGYVADRKVYSSANTVTYMVDTGAARTEEVDSGASCLSPKTFTPQKTGWSFVGWREDRTASAGVLESKVMADSPVTLYAVFRAGVTVTYFNNSTSASSTSGYRYYNNGSVVNPSFQLTQASSGGWTARGWSTSNQGNAGITYANGAAFTRDSNVTLYGLYQQTITVTYYNNSTSASRTTGTRYWAPAGYVNPSFQLTQASSGGWTARGWSTGNTANSGITYNNGATFTRDTNVTLYGMYQQTITVTYYNGNTTAARTTGTRYYCPGSGKILNPTFALTQAGLSGWSARGWSTGTAGNSSITYNNGAAFTRDSSITLYGMYQQTITLSYNGNGASGGSTAAQSGTRYYNSNGASVNPSFALRVNGFSRGGCTFKNWALGNAGGTQYAAGAGITLSASTVMYAVWTGIQTAITLSKNNTYLYSYDTHIDVNKPDFLQIYDTGIDCSLYRGIQFKSQQTLCFTLHEGTGAAFGMYESAGGAFLTFANFWKDWGSVGGAQHTQKLIADGTVATLNFAKTSGITRLYVGFRPYNGSTRAYGNAFFILSELMLIPR